MPKRKIAFLPGENQQNCTTQPSSSEANSADAASSEPPPPKVAKRDQEEKIYLHHHGAPLEEATFQKIRSGLIDLHVELLQKKAKGEEVAIPKYKQGLHRETVKEQVLDLEKEVLARRKATGQDAPAGENSNLYKVKISFRYHAVIGVATKNCVSTLENWLEKNFSDVSRCYGCTDIPTMTEFKGEVTGNWDNLYTGIELRFFFEMSLKNAMEARGIPGKAKLHLCDTRWDRTTYGRVVHDGYLISFYADKEATVGILTCDGLLALGPDGEKQFKPCCDQ